MDPLTYRAAGVDIAAGDEAVRRIKPLAASTHRPEVLGGVGAFAAFCQIPKGYTEPVLVSSTDGVGTKLKTFNMGVGFLVVVARADAARAQSFLQAAGERVFEVGEIRMGGRGVRYV